MHSEIMIRKICIFKYNIYKSTQYLWKHKLFYYINVRWTWLQSLIY